MIVTAAGAAVCVVCVCVCVVCVCVCVGWVCVCVGRLIDGVAPTRRWCTMVTVC